MNRDVAERLLELSKTGLEGLEYVRDQIGLGKYEQSMSVFIDVVYAFTEIEDVLVHISLNKIPIICSPPRALSGMCSSRLFDPLRTGSVFPVSDK